jgi:putative membrane protein
MFLGAFWNPYGHLDRLPVAVVNSDQGAVYEGKEMHVGQDFIDKLKEKNNFEYSFVDKSDALKGLHENEYYMAIEIPENFSAKTATLTTGQPTPAEILFMPNESANYLASQIGNNAVEKMKTELGKEVTKAYTQTVFDQMRTLADGLSQASDGASEIAIGTDAAKDGAFRIEENLKKLATGSISMMEGIDKLADGSGKLERGAAELRKGSDSLAGGLVRLTDAGASLEQGADRARIGASELERGLEQSAAGTSKLDEGAKALAEGLEQYVNEHPELAEDARMQQLIALGKEVSTGASSVKQGQTQLVEGSKKLEAGTSELATGLTALGEKLVRTSAGGDDLAKGAATLHAGASELNVGLGSLSRSFVGLVDGSNELDQGAAAMSEGLVKLTDGTGQLSDKLSEAAEKTAGIGGGEAVINMFSDPVGLDVVRTNEVPNYGTGFAPYFISMGLYVGALLLTVVYMVKEPAIQPANGRSWFVGKLLTMITIGTGQAIIADLVLLFGLGLEVRNIPLFILLSVVTSITFMALIQLLVASMHNPGRFIAIIILIFQLTSSGGTFPLEMIPGWLQKISAWLPMTHTIEGFKAVISSGDLSLAWNSIGLMSIYFAVFATMSLLYYMLAFRKEYKQNHQPSMA